MYAIIPQQIPQDRRAEINEKILFAIDSGKDLVPKESIYNCYTGIGGLHNLRQTATREPEDCTASDSRTSPATMTMPRPRRNLRWDSSSPRTTYAET